MRKFAPKRMQIKASAFNQSRLGDLVEKSIHNLGVAFCTPTRQRLDATLRAFALYSRRLKFQPRAGGTCLLLTKRSNFVRHRRGDFADHSEQTPYRLKNLLMLPSIGCVAALR